MAGGGGGWLPEEIAFDILPRLRTTASVARFRCVNKSWCTFLTALLLSDPNFIRKAIFFSDEKEIEINNKARLMFPPTAWTYYSIHSLDDNTLPRISSGTLSEWAAATEGCCDGIFCVSATRITLWNPTTSEVKVLPSHLKFLGRTVTSQNLHRDYNCNRANIGFGFDPKTNDYKVVFTYKLDELGRMTCVYSLGENSWRNLDQPILEQPSSIGRKKVGVFNPASRSSSSSCLWLDDNCGGNDHLNFTMFNMSREAFTRLQLPWPGREEEYINRSGLEMATNGPYMIAVDLNAFKSRDLFKVWATLDYASLEREKCSWIMLYDIVIHSHETPSFSLFRRELKVVSFLKHGKWLAKLTNEDRLVVIDAEKKEWSRVRLDTRWLSLEGVTYVPSMVSLSQLSI